MLEYILYDTMQYSCYSSKENDTASNKVYNITLWVVTQMLTLLFLSMLFYFLFLVMLCILLYDVHVIWTFSTYFSAYCILIQRYNCSFIKKSLKRSFREALKKRETDLSSISCSSGVFTGAPPFSMTASANSVYSCPMSSIFPRNHCSELAQSALRSLIAKRNRGVSGWKNPTAMK